MSAPEPTASSSSAALTYLHSALAANPHKFTPALRLEAAAELVELEAWDEAEALYCGLLDNSTVYTEACLGLARSALKRDCPAEAVPHLQAVLARDPAHIPALLELAAIHAADNVSEAEALYRAVLRHEPDHPAALIGLARLARLRSRIGRHDAVAAFDASLKEVQHSLEPQAEPRGEPALSSPIAAAIEEARAIETVSRPLRSHASDGVSSGTASTQHKPLPPRPAAIGLPSVHTPHQVDRTTMAKPSGRRLRPLALALVCGAAMVMPISPPSFEAIPLWDGIANRQRALDYTAELRAARDAIRDIIQSAVEHNNLQSDHASSRIGLAPLKPALAAAAAQVEHHDPELATSPSTTLDPTHKKEDVRATADWVEPDPNRHTADLRTSHASQAVMDPSALDGMRATPEPLMSAHAADAMQSRSASHKPSGEPDTEEHAARHASPAVAAASEASQAINPVSTEQSPRTKAQERHPAAAMPLDIDEQTTGGLGPNPQVSALAQVATPTSGLDRGPSSGAQAAPSHESSIGAPAASGLTISVELMASNGSPPQTSELSRAPPALASAGIAASPPQGRPATPQSERLLIRARMLLEQRDVSGARLILEHLVRAGSRPAAFLLAQTYDPRVQAPWRGYATHTDPLKADELYRMAQDQGVVGAADRVAKVQ